MPYTSKDKDGVRVIETLTAFAQRHGTFEMLCLIEGVAQAYSPITEITLDQDGEEIDCEFHTVQ